MRSIVFVAALVILAGWLMFRHGPVTSANAETAVDRRSRIAGGGAPDGPAGGAGVLPRGIDRPVGRLQEVRSIALDGPRIPLSRLRAVLETHPGGQLDAARLGRDRDAMERALSDAGYLAAHVEPAQVTFDAAGAAYVTFEVDPGPMFHLRNVEVTGGGRDVAVVTLVSGDDAVRERIELARSGLADVLARRGRPATVELSVHTDLAAAAVDVVLATR